MNPPKAERAKPSLSSDYNLLFKNKIGESSLDIHRYHRVHHLDTARQIIMRWAPPNENNTIAYAKHVASNINKDIDEPIPFDIDPTYYLAIAKTIARHENGVDAMSIPDETWEEAFKMAGF